MHIRHAVLAATFAVGALAVAPLRADAQGYVVVVNAANSATTLPKGEVAALFLKRVTSWPDGSAVAVVDQVERSRTRAEFSRSVLGRPVNAIRSYWNQQAFSGGEAPPPQRATDLEVLAYVRENPNAIGYVARTTQLGGGVKPLTIVGK